MVEHKHILIILGFLAISSLFSAVFLYDPTPSLTGYVVINGATKVSTDKLDPALVKEINTGNNNPKVILILDNSSTSLEQVQQEVITSLEKDLVVSDSSTESNSPPTIAKPSPDQSSGQSPEIDLTISHTFETISAIALEVNSPEALVELTKEKKVKRILLDYPIETTLDTSNPQINSPLLWNTLINDTNNWNLTGKGQTICVIDTGIDYTHPALGGCNPIVYQLTGTPLNLSTSNITTPIESNHPYNDSTDTTWVIQQDGFSHIALHFTNISLETQNGGSDTLDRIYIYDQYNNTIAIYKGTQTDIWTPHAEGDTLYVRLVTDSSLTDYGFFIDQILNGTTNTTMNWSNCSVVLGGWDTYNSDSNPIDDHGHGTHVAGIIASRNETYRGVAPESTLASVKALNSNGGGYSSDVVAGIEWCNKNAARLNISVISMSLGCGGASCVHYTTYCEQDLTSQAINDSYNRNISVFIASGNSGWTDGISNPSCVEKSIPIGGLTETNTIAYNRGNLLKILAPATSIRSTTLGGAWTSLSGTSMATPHAAAVAAIMQQYHKAATGHTQHVPGIEERLSIFGHDIADSSSGLTFTALHAPNATLPHIIIGNVTPISGISTNDSNVTIYFQSDYPLHNVSLIWLYPNTSNETITVASNNGTSFAANVTLNTTGTHSYYALGIDPFNLTVQSETRTITKGSELTFQSSIMNNSNYTESLEFNLTLSSNANLTLHVTLTNDSTLFQTTNNSLPSGTYNLPYLYNLTSYAQGSYSLATTIITPAIEQVYNYTIIINRSHTQGNASTNLTNSTGNSSILTSSREGVTILSPANNTLVELGTSTELHATLNLTGNYTYVWYTGDLILESGVTNVSDLLHYFNSTTVSNTTIHLDVTQNTTYEQSITLQTIDSHPPEITDLKFNNPHHRAVHGEVQISAILADYSTINILSIAVGDATSTEGCEKQDHSAECSWTIPSIPSGKYPFVITASDIHENTLLSNHTLLVIDCEDKMQNGNEEGVDCGGSCGSCTVTEQASQVAPVLTQEEPAPKPIPEPTQVNYTSTLTIKEERKEKQHSVLYVLGGLGLLLGLIAFVLHRRD